MPEGKTIIIENDPDSGVSSVTVEQTGVPADEGLNVGGVSLNTDLPWFLDALIVLLLVALIYFVKKSIDKWFEERKKK